MKLDGSPALQLQLAVGQGKQNRFYVHKPIIAAILQV
jgi:hypothetical protein